MTVQWEPASTLQDVAEGREEVSGAYTVLLSKCPVAHYQADEGCSLGKIFGHDEVKQAAADTVTFSSVTVPEGSPRILPLMADPPEQTAYRRLMNKFFFPGSVGCIEADARAISRSLMDPMVRAGAGDFAAGYAYPFSTRVLCRFLEVEDDWNIYDDWSVEMERLTKAGMAKPALPVPIEHFQKVMPYLEKLTADRRANPGSDAVSGIFTGEIRGESLDDQAVIGLVIALMLAGRSTTASGLGNLVLRLARNADLQQFLRENPDRIPKAVEECLRLDAPQQEQLRVCTPDTEIGGQAIKASDQVFLNWGSANVDPSHWDQLAALEIDRIDKKHCAFGHGVHQCFGAPLASLEMRLTAEELLAATESFAVPATSAALRGPGCPSSTCRSTLSPPAKNGVRHDLPVSGERDRRRLGQARV